MNGSREISFTIVSMTLSLVAVFIPVLFMGGIVGRLLNEFAVTIVVAVLISGVVSLSLTPMLCSIMLRPSDREKHGRAYQACEQYFRGNAPHVREEPPLGFALQAGRAPLSPWFSCAGVVYLYVVMPKGFLPSEDSGQIIVPRRRPRGHRSNPWLNIRTKSPTSYGRTLNVDIVMSNVGRGLIQYGEPHDPVEAPECAQQERGRGNPEPEAEAGFHPRHPGLPAESAAYPHRRIPDKEPVPVYPPEPGYRRAVPLCPDARGKAEGDRRIPGRDERPSDQEPADIRQHRPGQGIGAGFEHPADRERPRERISPPGRSRRSMHPTTTIR